MDLPIRFPNEADVIAEEAARFRALSPEARIHALGDAFREYHFLASVDRSGKVHRYALEEERQGRMAIEEFVARHG